MFGTFVQSLIGIIDGAFVSNLGNIPYNAVGNAGILYIALFMLCRGLADGTQIRIANLLGQNKKAEIGQLLFNAQAVQLLLAACLFILIILVGPFFIASISKSTEMAEAMSEFLAYRSWGLFFAALQVTLVAFFIGLGKTRIIIASTLLMALSNIGLDYAMIFGKLGMPELGMKGAAIASSCAEVITFFFLFLVASKTKEFQEFNYHLKHKIVPSLIKKITSLSLPLMGQGFISLFTWLVFFSMIEHTGQVNLEVAHNIRYMYFLAFVPIFGFGAATRTFVSNMVGAEKNENIPLIQKRIALLSFSAIVLVFHGAFLYPEALIDTINKNPVNHDEILALSAKALRFVAGSIVIYSVAVVPFYSIAALGKTRITFYFELIAIALYLVGCYLFIHLWNWDIISVWWVEYLYFGSLGVASVIYLYVNRYKLGLLKTHL